MRAVVQRVSNACVSVDGVKVAEIESGLLVFLGIVETDKKEDIKWLSNKLANLSIFNDSDNMMNSSLKDCEGSALIVSQFTLHAQIKKGNRLSYNRVAKSEIAKPLYEQFIEKFEADLEQSVHRGEFGANMKVALINDGPLTIIIDTKKRE